MESTEQIWLEGGMVKDATREAGEELVAVRVPVEICEHVSSTGELGDGIKEQALVIAQRRGWW